MVFLREGCGGLVAADGAESIIARVGEEMRASCVGQAANDLS